MAQGEVLAVQTDCPDPELLCGCNLDTPRPGDCLAGYSLEITGWVVGRTSEVMHVNVLLDSTIIRKADVWISRPDVARVVMDSSEPESFVSRCSSRLRLFGQRRRWAGDPENCGFHVVVSTLGLPPEFELRLEAVLQDGSRASLGSLKGRHSLIQLPYLPRRQPVMMSHLGRSGSTWLAHLLAEHPGVVIHRRYPFEAIAAVHTLQMLQVISTPAAPLRQSDLELTGGVRPQIGSMPLYCRDEDPHIHAWMRKEYVEQFATHCLQTIDRFYEEVAGCQAKESTRYFCEKTFTFPMIAPLAAELYPNGRSIFLVRDFRDTICSSRKFRIRRNQPEFADWTLIIQCMANASRQLLGLWKILGNRSHLVRYEHLVISPVETLKELFAFLDLENDDTTIRSVIDRASQNQLDLNRHLTSADPIKSIGRWKVELPAALHRSCIELLSDALEAFGYEDPPRMARAA